MGTKREREREREEREESTPLSGNLAKSHTHTHTHTHSGLLKQKDYFWSTHTTQVVIFRSCTIFSTLKYDECPFIGN